MAYIGTQPLAGQYRKLDNISSGFNGANTSFTTSVGGTNVTAGSPQQLLVSLGGVIQQPTTDYTVNTNTIIFTTAPAAGLDFFAVLMGDALNTSVPADGSITSAKLAGSLSIGFAQGSAAAPSVFFSGDTNTGVYSPGADQVAVATNGTGRLFIDSSGRLLVGTSTARSNFFGTTLSSLTQTEGTGGAAGRGALSVINNDVSNNPPYVLLGRSGAATLGSNAAVVSGSRLGTLTFHGADGTSFIEAATVAGEVDGTPGTNDMPGRLVFSTTADGAASPTERMRITSAGLVGIGTSAPGAELNIVKNLSGGLGAQLIVENQFGSAGSEAAILCRTNTACKAGLHVVADDGGTGTGNGNYLYFTTTPGGSTTETPRMTITRSGNVGIGTTSPVATLHSRADSAGSGSTPLLIQNRSVSANTAVGISFAPNTSDTADRSAIIYGVNSSGGSGNATDLTFHTNANGGSPSEKARIDSSGRLLVGTSSYTGNSKFAITGGAGTDVALLDLRFGGARPTAADSGICEIRFGSPDQTSNNSYAKIECITDGASSSNTDLPARLVFSTTADGASSPTERMRITSNGTISANNLFVSYTTFLAFNTAAAGTTNTIFNGRHSATAGDAATGTNSILIWNNGNIQNTNGSYTTISDVKLKENIVDAGSQWDDLKAIQIRNWNFKAETGHETHRQIGPIAQELEAVCPGLVFETPDRDEDGNETGEVTKGVNQSVLYMKAVKALQEAMERIEQLEASNADLLARVTALETA